MLSIIKRTTKRTEPEFRGNALADFRAKADTTKPRKIVAHVDDLHFASANVTPQCQILPSCCLGKQRAICSSIRASKMGQPIATNEVYHPKIWRVKLRKFHRWDLRIQNRPLQDVTLVCELFCAEGNPDPMTQENLLSLP